MIWSTPQAAYRANELADLLRRSDGTAQRAQSLLEELRAQDLAGLRRDAAIEAEQRAVLLELVPHVRHARLMRAEDVVVAERVAEEVPAVEPTVDGRLLVVVAHERNDDGEVRVDGEAARHALVGLQGVVVVVHPTAGF